MVMKKRQERVKVIIYSSSISLIPRYVVSCNLKSSVSEKLTVDDIKIRGCSRAVRILV